MVNLILCGIIAGLATALSGAFILPSVAGDELRQSIGMALLGVGKSLSGYTQLNHAVIPRPSHAMTCAWSCMSQLFSKHAGDVPTWTEWTCFAQNVCSPETALWHVVMGTHGQRTSPWRYTGTQGASLHQTSTRWRSSAQPRGVPCTQRCRSTAGQTLQMR